MKLDRNINKTGKGKYAFINLRKIPGDLRTPEDISAAILANPECVEFGEAHGPNEFFLLKLNDKYAADALIFYADAASEDDTEYSEQIRELATRSGTNNPFCKKPD
jgi:hypothetical protein